MRPLRPLLRLARGLGFRPPPDEDRHGSRPGSPTREPDTLPQQRPSQHAPGRPIDAIDLRDQHSRSGVVWMNWFLDVVGHLSDGAILLCGALLTATAALAVSLLARRLVFVPSLEFTEEHRKLAELVHSSFLAFTVFVLALVLTDVRSNLGKADDTVLREASTLSRLDRELGIAGSPKSTVERTRLREYANAVVRLEWPSLGAPEPSLSPEVAKIMTALIEGVRSVAASQPSSAGTLVGLLDKLDDLRQGRLESATRSVPPIFWWMILAFLLGAMILNGRHSLDRASAALITLHMAAIGLVMAFILIMDEPFRGESSISPEPILGALSSSF
jgi:hypothetical protein